jgi:hypothetical protein
VTLLAVLRALARMAAVQDVDPIAVAVAAEVEAAYLVGYSPESARECAVAEIPAAAMTHAAVAAERAVEVVAAADVATVAAMDAVTVAAVAVEPAAAVAVATVAVMVVGPAVAAAAEPVAEVRATHVVVEVAEVVDVVVCLASSGDASDDVAGRTHVVAPARMRVAAILAIPLATVAPILAIHATAQTPAIPLADVKILAIPLVDAKTLAIPLADLKTPAVTPAAARLAAVVA